MSNHNQLFEALIAAGLTAETGVPLAPYTTFRIGGPAAVFCTPVNEVQLLEAVRLCRELGERCYLLGRGSNTLFADEGFDGLVLHIGEGLDEVTLCEEGTLTAGAGAKLTQLCRKAADASLAGLEFAYGIPGSLGGAIYMNAGAYGGEMKDVLTEVTFLDTDGSVKTLPAASLALGYRTSRFATEGGIILRAQLKLKQDEKSEILARMEALRAKRIEKQPLDKPSAGSTFKRPEGAFAAELIERCGLKGFCVGGAAVSEKHSGFVVNLGGASCADVLSLCAQVSAKVKEETGFVLEKEIKVAK